MTFAGLNIFSIALAAIASYIFGAVWYIALSGPWQRALGWDNAAVREIEKPKGPLPFIVTFIAQLIMAWVLAGLIGHMGRVSVRSGLISALFVWAGFVASTLAANHSFQGSKRLLTAIDGGHWLGVLLIQGLVIGWLGV